MTKPKRTIKEKFKEPFKSTTVEFWLFLLSVPLSMYVAGIVLMFIVESDKFDANWLSATGSVVAAAITGATLIVIVLQNKKMNQHAENVWRKQEEAMERTFNAEHRNSFNTFLDTLEDEHKGFFKVSDRTGLYNQVFSNGVEKFAKMNAPLAGEHCFSKCTALLGEAYKLANYDLESEKVSKEKYQNWHDKYKKLIFDSSEQLCLENIRTMKAGDIHENEFVYCNVFYKTMMLDQLGAILSKLSMFAQCETGKLPSDVQEQTPMSFKAVRIMTHFDPNKQKYKKVVFGRCGFVALGWLVFNTMVKLNPSFRTDATNELNRFLVQSSVKHTNVVCRGNEPSQEEADAYITELLEQLTDIARSGYVRGDSYDSLTMLHGFIEKIKEGGYMNNEGLVTDKLNRLLPETKKELIFK